VAAKKKAAPKLPTGSPEILGEIPKASEGDYLSSEDIESLSKPRDHRRDGFTAAIAQGFAASTKYADNARHFAINAVLLADALIAELDKPVSTPTE
jgi:hypothetical protein